MKLIILNKLLFLITVVMCNEDMNEFLEQRIREIKTIDDEVTATKIKNDEIIQKVKLMSRINRCLVTDLVLSFDAKKAIVNDKIVDLVKVYCSDAELSEYIYGNLTFNNKQLLEVLKCKFSSDSEHSFYQTSCAIFDILNPTFFTDMDKKKYIEYISKHDNLFSSNCASKFETLDFTLKESVDIQMMMQRKEDLFLPKAIKVYENIMKYIFEFKSRELDLNIAFYTSDDLQLNIKYPKESSIKILVETLRNIYKSGMAGFLDERRISKITQSIWHEILVDASDKKESSIVFTEILIELLNLCPKSDKLAYSIRLLPYFPKKVYAFDVLIRIINFFSIPVVYDDDSSFERYYHPFIFTFLNTMNISELTYEQTKELLQNVLARKYYQNSADTWDIFFHKIVNHLNTLGKSNAPEVLCIMMYNPGNAYFYKKIVDPQILNGTLSIPLISAYNLFVEREKYSSKLAKFYERFTGSSTSLVEAISIAGN